ncbi:MAG: sigma-70 family RNA polymerase sigma factor [Solirubrobacteraceae bacterium]
MRPLDQATDEELFRLGAENEEAFVALYRRHARPLLAYYARRTSDPELAADACAEAFAVLAHHVLAGKKPPRSVSGWLYGTARHKVADAQRHGYAEARARARLGIPRLELTDVGIEAVHRAATETLVTAALNDLPKAQRDAIEARVVRDAPYETIARTQDVSPTTARQRVARGLAKLRTTVERPTE